MSTTSLGCLINLVVFISYFIFASEKRAWPSPFIFWAWLPFVAYFLLDRFCLGLNNTARGIAGVYFLRRDDLDYDHSTRKKVLISLIPTACVPLILLWKIGGVISFVCLLFWQGWATAIVANAAINLFASYVPINYQRHLERIQASFPQGLFPREVVELISLGVSLTSLRAVIDQAVEEHRNPQAWWLEVAQDLEARTTEEQEGG